MPLPDPGTYPLSNKDVLSFTFDDPDIPINQPILIDPNDPSINFSHSSAKRLVRQLIAGLQAAGLKHGETVCIHSFNSITYPLIVLAIIGAGGLCVGTNPSYTRHELNHCVRVAKIRTVFAEPEILSNMVAALEENKIDVGSRMFILDTQPGQTVPKDGGLKSWRSLLSDHEEDWIRFDDFDKSKDTVAQLYYTSGTTGLPKCAMTTHRNLVSVHQMFFEANPRSYQFKIVFCMPFFHVGILPQVIVSAIRQGREAYVMRRFDLVPYLKYHGKYKITETFMAPPMVVSIVTSELADEDSKAYDAECSLRTVMNGTVGGAPTSGDMQKRFHALLNKAATFGQVWGMTETTAVACFVPWDVARKTGRGEMDEAWGNVGKPLPGNKMKLIDDDGEDVTDQGRGELCIKGPSVVKCYFENEEATKNSFDDEGYLRTGDVVRVDKETGLMYIEERVKELIKVRGFQVAPAELEGVLTAHPDIVDAAVIAKAGDNGNELPKAFVIRREGANTTEEQVQVFMKERLTGYKQLTGGVQFVESIPKLPSGKILKRVLRDTEMQEEASHRPEKLQQSRG